MMLLLIDNFTYLSTRILLKRYIAVFSLVILLLLLGYVMTLGQQQLVQDDLALLNLITRQRMFSQKVSQNALLLRMAMSQRKRQEATLKLADTLTQWQQEEIALKKISLRLTFSNEAVGLMFNDLEQHYQTFYEASTVLLRLVVNSQASAQPINLATEAVLAEDDHYLQVIDTVVARHQILVEQRNNIYVQTKLGLLSLTIVLLLLETAFIFRPALAEMGGAFKAMQETQSELEALNQQLQQKITEIAHAQEAYRVLVDNSLQGLAIIQGEKIRFINQRLATILGYETPAALLAMSATEMQSRHTHPTSLAVLEQYRQDRRQGKAVPNHYEVQIITVDQQIKWVEHYVTVITYYGQPVVQIATFDITLRKQTQAKLKESERFLRHLTDSLPGMVGYWTPDLRCTFANQAYLTWFGRTSEQMLGVTMLDLMGQELFRKNEPFIRGVLQGEYQNFERTLIKADGTTGYTWAQYIPDLAEGELQGFFVLVTDITIVKQTQEALRVSELKLRTVFELLPVGISILDKNYRVVEVNSTLERILQLSLANILQGDYKPRRYIQADGSPMTPQEFPSRRVIIEQQPIYDVEIGIITERNEIIWTLISAAPVMVADLAAVVVTQDITARKKIELELQQRQLYLTMLVNLQKILLASENAHHWYHYLLPSLGQTARMSQALYFEVDSLDGEVFVRLKAEWLQRGIPSMLGDNRWQSISLSFVPLWEQMSIQGNPMFLSLENGSWFEQELLVTQGAATALLLPLHVNHQLVGFINLADLDTARVWSQSELDILWMAIASISLYLEKLQRDIALQTANDRLEQLANLDGLTQIANRRHFDHYLYQEWQQLENVQASLSLLMVDVDHFKLYNDTYGHIMGDSCLRQVANVMNRAVKHSWDLVARYGGEEFVVILPNTDEAGAMVVANKIRQEMLTCQIPHASSPDEPYLTVSIGVSTVMPQPNVTPEMLVSAADLALYQAKQQGRNGIVSRPVA